MRTTIDVDQRLMAKAKMLNKQATAREIINTALREYIAHRAVKKISDFEGKLELNTTVEKLIAERRQDVSR